MRRVKRKLSKDLTPQEIGRFTRLIRKILNIHSQKAPNLLLAFEALRRIFPRLRIRIVEDSDLPDAEARAYPASWIIKIRKGIYEGLLRGDTRARWTFAHELGHVLLQHPGKPHRLRATNGQHLVEQQADAFAAQLLAPFDLAKEYKISEAIALAFKLSAEAARRRLREIHLEERSKNIGERRSTSNVSETSRMEDFAALICSATLATIAEHQSSRHPIQPWKDNLFGSCVVVAAGTQLLIDAYESVRPEKASKYITGACLAAAIYAIKPIRAIESTNANAKVALTINELCAVKAAGTLLKWNSVSINNFVSNGGLLSTEIVGGWEFLKPLVNDANALIIDPTTVVHFRQIPTYYNYNGIIDITWRQINDLEHLARTFELWLANNPA